MSKYDQENEGSRKKDLSPGDSGKTGDKEMLENTKGRKQYNDRDKSFKQKPPKLSAGTWFCLIPLLLLCHSE